MRERFTKRVFEETIKARGRYFAISLASFTLFVLVSLGIGGMSEILKPLLISNIASIAWLIVSGVIVLTLGAIVISGMSGLAIETSKENSIKIFLKYSKQNWFSNFFIILIIWIMGVVIIGASIEIPRWFLPIIGMNGAVALIVLIQMGGLLGIMSFVSLASFIPKEGKGAIKYKLNESKRIVKNNYLNIAWIILLFGVISQVPPMIEGEGDGIGIIIECIFALIIFPVFVIIMSKSAKILK